MTDQPDFDNLNATGEEYDQNEPEVFSRQVLQSISPLGLDARIVQVFGINPAADNYVSSVMAIVDILPEEVVHLPGLKKTFSVRPAKALEDFLGVDVAAAYLAAPAWENF